MPTFIIDKSGTKETKLSKQKSGRSMGGKGRSVSPSSRGALKKVLSIPRLKRKDKSAKGEPIPAEVVSLKLVDKQKLVAVRLDTGDVGGIGKHITLADDFIARGRRHTDVVKGSFHVVSKNAERGTVNIIVEKDGNPNSMTTYLFTKGKSGTRVILA